MGVSTVSAYRGAQVFEAIGLGPELVERHFVGTPSKLGGLGLRGLAREVLERHARTYLPAGGLYRWRRDGERHGWNPDTVAALQRGEWRRYVEASDDAARHGALRGQLAFRDATRSRWRTSSPRREIMKRFATGAMSLGSISPEAHESLALAMNEIGGRSNTGEGGEDPARFVDDAALRDQAGGVRRASASRSTTWSTPTSCRSRSLRAPSPARAASSRATRSTPTSAGCATPRPAWS